AGIDGSNPIYDSIYKVGRSFYGIPVFFLYDKTGFQGFLLTIVLFGNFGFLYLKIIVTGSEEVQSFCIAIIFIFRGCPIKFLTWIVIFASKVYSYIEIQRIPRTGIIAENQIWIYRLQRLPCCIDKVMDDTCPPL